MIDPLPEPGEWSINWVCGDVASWYHGDNKRGAMRAHFFDCHSGTYIEVGDARLDLEGKTDDEKRDTIAAALEKHKPETPTNA